MATIAPSKDAPYSPDVSLSDLGKETMACFFTKVPEADQAAFREEADSLSATPEVGSMKKVLATM